MVLDIICLITMTITYYFLTLAPNVNMFKLKKIRTNLDEFKYSCFVFRAKIMKTTKKEITESKK